MAHVEDRWLRKDKSRTPRYGKGLRWRVVGDAGGQRISESFATRDAATAHLATLMTSLREGTYVPRSDMTVGEMWERFRLSKNGTSRSSQKAYDAAWGNHLSKWANEPLRLMKSTTVREWLPTLTPTNKKGSLSASYANYLLSTLKAVMEYAVEDGQLAKNPLAPVRGRKVPSTSRTYLEVSQVDRLLAEIRAITPDAELAAYIMLRTGCRPAESWGFQVKHYNKRRKRLRVERDIDSSGKPDETKTGRHRDLPVSHSLAVRLAAACKGKGPEDLIVCHESGNPWKRDTWRPLWKRATELAGLDDVDTYALRHTGISWAIHAGANIKTVQRMAGHASARMTLDVYGHLWDAQLDDVVAAVDEHLEMLRTPTEHPSGR